MYVLVKLVSGQSPEIIDSYSSRKAAEHWCAAERTHYKCRQERWFLLDAMVKCGIEIGSFRDEYVDAANDAQASSVVFKILTARG